MEKGGGKNRGAEGRGTYIGHTLSWRAGLRPHRYQSVLTTRQAPPPLCAKCPFHVHPAAPGHWQSTSLSPSFWSLPHCNDCADVPGCCRGAAGVLPAGPSGLGTLALPVTQPARLVPASHHSSHANPINFIYLSTPRCNSCRGCPASKSRAKREISYWQLRSRGGGGWGVPARVRGRWRRARRPACNWGAGLPGPPSS